jgi:hypothetical protein
LIWLPLMPENQSGWQLRALCISRTSAGRCLLTLQALELMLAIFTKGMFRRPVIVIGPVALKFARNAEGRACNNYEADLYRNATAQRRTMLCPVLWVSRKGFLLIMRAAAPLTENECQEAYLDLGRAWDPIPGEDGCPFEPKASDWGWYHGRRVALDYSTPVWGDD